MNPTAPVTRTKSGCFLINTLPHHIVPNISSKPSPHSRTCSLIPAPPWTGKYSLSAVNVHYVHDRHPLLVLQTACRPRAPEILLWSINPVYYSPDRIHADFSHRFHAASRQARDSRESIKPRIKAQDSLDSMVLHDGQMHSITLRHLSMSHDNFLCALCCDQINSPHLVK